MPLQPFQNISLSDYQYDLPENRIALYPAALRDHSKLLVRHANGIIKEDLFRNISNFLPEKSHLFFNNSRVIPARILFPKETGAQIEIFCLKPVKPSDYAISLSSSKNCIWLCMIGNIKKFKSNSLELRIPYQDEICILTADKFEVRGNIAQIRFSWDKDISFAAMLSLAGAVPLPPYIKREPVQIDRERYQTIYSSQEGSVAAPTAGLHFTDYVFSTLKEKGLACHEITLHVGAGTFQPVKTEKIADHAMHAEYFEVHQSLIKLILSLGHRVSCVGTTSVRTLESLYWTGVKLCNFPEADSLPDLDQWEAYFLPQNYSIEKSFTALDEWFIRNKIQRAFASTKLMIIPGYQFRMTDTLITNFHQPGSTLLLLIGAFIGKSWKEVYDYALNHEFRFLSYGDSSLLFNSPSQIS